MHGQATEERLAGRVHDDGRLDLMWSLDKPHGNWAIRTLGYGLRKTLRRCTTAVTFDRPSFRRAAASMPDDALFILAPSHRSYFDFLLSSYLCFQHPELEIPVPHIAAAEEFSRIPLVGRLLQRSQAFYVRRGVGKEVHEVSDALRRLVAREASVMFFIEGQRSRSRQALVPRRGLLRALQATGRKFVVLPIAISYDRVPEESSFERELSGGRRSRMSLTAILRWLSQMARDEVQLGRIHLACGEPLPLDTSSDVRGLAKSIVSEQLRHTAATSFHLRTFLENAALPGVDEAWLADAIRRRGGRVLDSDLAVPTVSSPAFQQSLRNQWMHWFHDDARALLPHSLVVRDHTTRHGWYSRATPPEDVADPRVKQVVSALFGPIALDYALVAQRLGTPGRSLDYAGPQALVGAYPSAHLPTITDAYLALADRGILRDGYEAGRYTWGPSPEELETFRAQTCADAWALTGIPAEAPRVMA
ncbi:1-acyl-sn-glycerol-3-phosphate acyltransferase [Chondromyces crocatus]|uniref:Glycerol-3-phosphate acyltransferase n=1 Tax=Chondromyces crocatus TaxID=52 RepID=A0A0K1EB79_CHOCO|nr:1-acyl-sn-glycerol-3-phosphate acyltransferase [Chondromyces crocatus]AKT37947.1 uncharacterized protein CMC5_020880 [Chondromyces crocatus]